MRPKILLSFLWLFVPLFAAAQLATPGTITGSASTCSGTSAACVVQPLYNSPQVSTATATITLVNSFTGTIQFEVTSGAFPDPGTDTWFSIQGVPVGGGSAVTSATAAGSWQFSVAGYTQIRARASALSVGTVSVAIIASVQNSTAPTATSGTTITPANVSGTAQVDGVGNPTMAGALFSPLCLGTSQNGCSLLDNLPETFYYNPLRGGQNYKITLGKGTPSGTAGNWLTAVPIVLSSDQILASYRPGAPSGAKQAILDGSSGTVLRVCDPAAQCAGGNFPNMFPTITTAATVNGLLGTAASGGALSNGTYVVQILPFVNLNTAADGTPTASQPQWSAIGATVYPGEAINDNTTNCLGSNHCTWVARIGGTKSGSQPAWAGSGGQILTESTGVQWVNIGPITTAFNNTYGSPGFGLATAEGSITLSGGGSAQTITIANMNTSWTYPACADGTSYGGLGTPQAPPIRYCTANGRLWRAIGGAGTAGTAATATFATLYSAAPCSSTPGCQVVDVANTLYWDDEGATSGTLNLPIYGWIPLIGTTSGKESAQASTGCSATVQLANLTLCAPTATFTQSTALATSGFYAPLADTSNSLVAIGARPDQVVSGAAQFGSVLANLWLEAEGMAGVCINMEFAQEMSVADTDLCDNPAEAGVFVGIQSTDSYIQHMSVSNYAGGNFQFARVGGIIVDGSLIAAPRYLLDDTVTFYNEPSAGAVTPYGELLDAAGYSQTIGHHAEVVQYGYGCGGDPVRGTNGQECIASTLSCGSSAQASCTVSTALINNNGAAGGGANLIRVESQKGQSPVNITDNVSGTTFTGTGVNSDSTDEWTVDFCAKNNASPAACGDAKHGVFVASSVTTYMVDSTAVGNNSRIFIQQVSDNTGIPSAPTCATTSNPAIVSARSVGTSFTIALPSLATACYEYWIVN
jgi:hypothetical protein